MLELSKRFLKLISINEIDTKKYYRIERKFINLIHRYRFLRPHDRISNDVLDAPDGHIIPIRIFYPEARTKSFLLIFFHGGGWVTGDLDSYEKVCLHMAEETGCIVVSVEYRLAPENKFPAAPNDCFFVTELLHKNARKLGFKSNELVLVGDSAGGNLAAVVSLMARDQGKAFPAKQILFYPATDSDHGPDSPYPSVHENGESYVLTNRRIHDFIDLYRRDAHDMTDPYFAPIHAEDMSHQPDTLIITAEFDPLRDEGVAYGKRLQAAGNRVDVHCIEDALHGFLSNRLLFSKPVAQSYQYINQFLQKESDEKN